MKKRKGRLLNRILAVLLSAVLTAGMVSNAVPASVFAQEGAESVSGNDMELTEDTVETEPDSEIVQESEVMPMAMSESYLEWDVMVEGYEGNVADIFTFTLKSVDTDEQVQINPIVDGNHITCKVTIPGTENLSSGAYLYYQWYLNGQKWYGKIGLANGGWAKYNNTIYLVRFMDGSDVYDTKYAVKWDAGDFKQNVTAPSAPSKEGFTFAGWVTTEGGSELFDFSKQVTSATTLYASWTENSGADNNIASGTGWVLDKDGKLTIKSNEGMTDWNDNRNTYKTQVKSVEIQNGVTSIGTGAFMECSKLTSITIPSSVTSINGFAFASCSSLTSITIPSNVTSIGNSAFQNCNKLASVTMAGEMPPEIGTSVFYGSACVKLDTKGIHVPTGKAQTYKNKWKDWAAYIADETTTEAHQHNGVTFTAWTATDSLPTDAGNYYLTENVTLSGTWYVPDGETTLCLNGKTISVSGKHIVIIIHGSKTLNLYDCQGGGNITGGQEGGIDNKGIFHMYGGKISGNGRAAYGGGVSNDGTFIMYGGEISGNSAFYYGGGVYVADGTFCMYGGNISGNTNDMGGGVYVKQGIFTIGGSAVISGNVYNGKANNVYLKDGQTITIDSSNPLSGSASIGIMTKTAPTDESPVNITGAYGADYSKHFTSDKTDYKIVNGKDNVVQLAPAKSDFDKLVETMQIVMAALNDYKATNDTTEESIQDIIDAAINKAGITDATVEVRDFQKIEATSEAEGSIQAKIYVECGTRNNTGYLTAKIDRLQPSHTHNLTLTEAKDATCTEEGNSAYYTCSGCGKYFTDAEGTSETTLDSVKISVLGHDYNTSEWGYKGEDGHAYKCQRTGCGEHDTLIAHTPGAAATEDAPQTCTACGWVIEAALGHTHNYGDWQHDDTEHWKVCSCGSEIDRAAHSFGNWVTDQAATATEAGAKHRDCQTCRYRQTETVPATGTEPGTGTITPEVIPGDHAPATDISTPEEELKDMLLTEEEKQQVQNGTNVRIVLEVQDAGNTVSNADKENIQQALNGFRVGQYLNIDLYKMVGTDRTDITKTAKKIRIVITVPDNLKNTDSSKTRTYAVIRVHDGRAELLADLDGSADFITIETDRFSTYAVVYKDTANGGNGGGNSGNDDNNGSNQNNSEKNDTKPDSSKDDEPKTGDTTPLELYATLTMIAGFTYLLLYFSDRRRGMSEETKKELVSGLVAWAKRGGKLRKCLALAAIFVLLVYYHSIGKKTCAGWREIYGE